MGSTPTLGIRYPDDIDPSDVRAFIKQLAEDVESEILSSGGGGGGGFHVQSTPPPDPSPGDVWFNTNTATTYVRYDGFWVE